MAEKNQTTKEGHQKKTGLAGKKRWIEKRLKRSTIDVVVTQNEEETSEDSTASSEQHTDLCTSPTWSSEPWNTSVDQSPNQLKPLAVKGSNYNSLRETERQQMKQIKTQHMETLNERHITEEVSQSPRAAHQPVSTERYHDNNKLMMMEYANEPGVVGNVVQQKRKPVTQPLMPTVGITSDNSHQSLPDSIEEELSSLETERDHYKRESEGKEQTIQQYQQELIQYKTKLRQYTSSQHKQSLEDETTQLKVKELVEEQLKVKEAELKQNYEEDLQKKLNQKEEELLQQRYDNDMRNKEQLIEQLKNRFTAETTKAADAIAERALLERRLKDIQKINEEQEQAKTDLQQKLAETKTQTELEKNKYKQLEEEKQKKESILQNLEKDIEDRKVTQKTLEATVKHLQDVLHKQEELNLAKDTELEQEREDKMRITKENEYLKNESKQTAIQAAERTKRLEEQLADKEQEVIKLTAINEERAIAHKVELEKANRQLEEFKVEKLQDGIEDGAKATPNNSLSDLEKLKVTLNLKDEEIQDLNEKIRKLEEEKRTAQHERDTEHALVVSQLDEVWKAKQDLEIEQEDLKRLSATHNDALIEIRDLKQRLFEKERDAQGQQKVQLKQLQHKLQQTDDLTKLQETHKSELHDKLQMYKTELEIMSKATKKESAELQTKIEQLKVENGNLQQELSETKKVLHETQRVYLTVETQKKQLETARDDTEEKVNIDLSDKTRQLEEENISLQQQLKTIKKETDDEKKKLESIQIDYDKLTGKMSHKEIELQDIGKTIQTLIQSAEEKSKTVKALRGQVATAANQLSDAKEAVNSKQKEIVELKEKLEVQQIQLNTFEEDFKTERADRERMNSKITALEGQILTLQQSLHDENHAKESVKAKMEMESLQREEQVAEWEEEKLVLTSQVNGYSRQCDELKKTLLQIQNKCKSLEDQLRHKTGLDTEINELKSKLHLQNELETEINQLKIQLQQKENEMKAQIHQKDSEINSLNVKCSETEKNFRKTESFVTQLQQELQSEYVDKQHLLSAFRQEQAKVENLENEMIKIANKILMEKVSSQKISAGHNISQRRNYPSTSEGYPVQPAMAATNSTNADIVVTQGQVHEYKEQLSGSYDLPPPQMNREQMREFGRRYDNQQREQQEEQWRRQQTLQQMEQQRQIEQARADKALEELEQLRLEQKRMEASKPQYQSNETRNDELVSGTSKPVTSEPDTSDDIPENPLIEGIDQDIQYYAEEAREMTRPPNDTKEFEVDRLPYDPNLVCPKCGKRYRIGEIQRFKRHLEERCPNRSSSNIMSQSQNCSNEQIFSGASDIIPENPLLDSDIHYHAEEVRNMVRPPSDSSDEDSSDNNMPYDPNLVCPKCGKRYRIGGIQRFKRHVEKRCPNRN